ncbi:hypothetical protein E2L92_21940 [Salmonella enterica subsp. enterica serovar Ibadan]|nr:hypothetical protein [Salmonella enterica subsp. enterica serovar Ibadan]ECF3282114.1 hypothetical protein [Salmonella enterica subsp. enterica serovar Ibadan]
MLTLAQIQTISKHHHIVDGVTRIQIDLLMNDVRSLENQKVSILSRQKMLSEELTQAMYKTCMDHKDD